MLIAGDRGKHFNFANIEHLLIASSRLLRRQKDLLPPGIPSAMQEEYAAAAAQLRYRLNAIRTAHAENNTDANRHQGLIDSLTLDYKSAFEKAAPIITFDEVFGGAASRQRAAIDALKKEANDIVDLVKKTAGSAVVQAQSKHFANAACWNRLFAMGWLIAVILVAGTIGFACMHSIDSPPVIPDQAVTMVALIKLAPRIVILSLLFYLLSLCARNYRANRHNEVVNRHRALALDTFNHFVVAAFEQKTRDVVLAHAASTVFTAQPTGYSNDQAEPLPQATAIELLQRLGAK
ncbi:hypothetical protein DRW03_21290 [Corallococcus sp. H22C18031201]|nr:hypothetical protein DRW03_21290 [Corallococcus sp. H22C18031201]